MRSHVRAFTRIACGALIALALAPPAFAAAPKAAARRAPLDLAALDAAAARAMKQFEIPGLSLAAVLDGELVVAKGYGVRRAGEPAPVDADTLFGIASNTKAVTAAALALLVEEGRLAWDDPVQKHLPWFQMHDPWVTRELSVRDLLTHRGGLGLGAGDLLYWPPSDYTRREIAMRARWLKPASSLRSRYAYSNLMYVVAGELLEAVSGGSWEDFVAARVLRPLGMTATTARLSELKAAPNAAFPHAPADGVLRALEPDFLENLAPAGGLYSSAREMSLWLQALLADGARAGDEGRRLLKPGSVRELWSGQTLAPIPASPQPGLEALQPRFSEYGLGFGLRDYRGRKLVTHTGGLVGMVSRVALVPEAGVGLVVLTNQESGYGRDAVAFWLLDRLLGETAATDWLAGFARAESTAKQRAEKTLASQAAARDAASRPSLPLEGFAGRYRDAWRGEATLAVESGRLVLRFERSPALTADLEHWQHDSFVARFRERSVPDAFVAVALGPDARVERITLKAVSPLADFSYDFQDLLLLPQAEPQ
ncbi:MAG: serine hydrolase [Vicinamibacteria bacterium]